MTKILAMMIMPVMMMFFPAPGFAQSQPSTKVYAVYLNDPQENSFVLQNPEAADFNGVKCVKGTHVGAGWAANRTIYIPVDKIIEIIEEDSLDQYKADTGTLKK